MMRRTDGRASHGEARALWCGAALSAMLWQPARGGRHTTASSGGVLTLNTRLDFCSIKLILPCKQWRRMVQVIAQEL